MPAGFFNTKTPCKARLGNEDIWESIGKVIACKALFTLLETMQRKIHITSDSTVY